MMLQTELNEFAPLGALLAMTDQAVESSSHASEPADFTSNPASKPEKVRPNLAEMQKLFPAQVNPLLVRLRKRSLFLTQNQEEADDLLQETLTRAYNFFDRFEQGTNLHAWLNRILHNLHINRHRRSQRRVEEVPFSALLRDDREFVEWHPNLIAEDPSKRIMDECLPEELVRAFQELPQIYRDVAIPTLIEGCSYKEIAAQLDCPVGTIRSRLSRAREILRNKLAEFARGQGIVLVEAA